MRREGLEAQIADILAEVTLPTLYDLWVNRTFARLSGTRESTPALLALRGVFPSATPDIQREIVTAIFSSMTLRDRKLTISLKPPFVFAAENQVTASLHQEPLGQKSLKKKEA